MASPAAAIFLARYGTGLSKQYIQEVYQRRLSDGYNLSDRVWRLGTYAEKSILDIVYHGISEGMSAVALSKLTEQFLIGRGPAWTTGVKRSVTGRGTVAYNSLRLARTEINQAYHNMQKNLARDNPLLIGQKWNLSNSHPHDWGPSDAYMGYDEICEYRALEDHHGLGPGVFPPGEAPPDHPNGLCYLTSVWKNPLDILAQLEGTSTNSGAVDLADFQRDVETAIGGEIYFRDILHSMLVKSQRDRYFKALGFTDEEAESARNLLKDVGVGGQVQERAEQEIIAHLQSRSRVGELLHKQIELETNLVKLWVSKADERFQKAFDYAISEFKRTGEYTYKGHYADTPEELAEIIRKYTHDIDLKLYRKGSLDRDILSWTSNPEGADMGGGRVGWDHTIDMRTLEQRGFRVLGGTSISMGAPGEAEITLIKNAIFR